MTEETGSLPLAKFNSERDNPRPSASLVVSRLVIKRLRRIGGRWHLTGDNPAYEPRPLASSEDQILGQVAGVGPPTPAD